jgi:primosomal protein N'
MVTESQRRVRVGDLVLVPWGLKEPVRGRVVEVWGDPQSHVRVRLMIDEEPDQPVVLLPESLLSLAA